MKYSPYLLAATLLLSVVSPHVGGSFLAAPGVMEERTDPDQLPEGFTLTSFNDEFVYTEDAFDEYYPVRQTIAQGYGDCEEYAAVSAAYLRDTYHGTIHVSVLVDYDEYSFHVVTWTKYGVYSSGNSHYDSLSGYMEVQGYDAIAYTNSIEGDGEPPVSSGESAGGAIMGQ